jgi:hypothetical protein
MTGPRFRSAGFLTSGSLRRPPPSARHSAATHRGQLKPPAAVRITASRTQLRHPRAVRSATSTRTMPQPAITATGTVPPGRPNPLCRIYCRSARSPARRRHPRSGAEVPSTRPTNVRTIRARTARPASVTLSRISGPAISAPAFPGRPAPGKSPGAAGPDVRECTLDSAAHVKPEPVTGEACPWKADGAHRPLWWPDARPLYVRGHRDTGIYSATG